MLEQIAIGFILALFLFILCDIIRWKNEYDEEVKQEKLDDLLDNLFDRLDSVAKRQVNHLIYRITEEDKKK